MNVYVCVYVCDCMCVIDSKWSHLRQLWFERCMHIGGIGTLHFSPAELHVVGTLGGAGFAQITVKTMKVSCLNSHLQSLERHRATIYTIRKRTPPRANPLGKMDHNYLAGSVPSISQDTTIVPPLM